MPREFPSSLEESEEFEQIIQEGIEAACNLISARYEDASRPDELLPYHNVEHTRRVLRYTERILQAIRQRASEVVNERDLWLGLLAAAFHDAVQDWEPVNLPDGFGGTKTIRSRLAGQNEAKSASEAELWMRKANLKAGREIFSQEDMSKTREAIMATVPDFDTENKTVAQKNLTPASSMIARALALADLGAAGLGDQFEFLYDGDALFREENLDITRAIQVGATLNQEIKERFRQRMLSWIEGQVPLAAGRQARLARETEDIPLAARDAVRDLFENFGRTNAALWVAAARRQQQDFLSLAADIGYKFPYGFDRSKMAEAG